jgi:hypothetical protein
LRLRAGEKTVDATAKKPAMRIATVRNIYTFPQVIMLAV